MGEMGAAHVREGHAEKRQQGGPSLSTTAKWVSGSRTEFQSCMKALGSSLARPHSQTRKHPSLCFLLFLSRAGLDLSSRCGRQTGLLPAEQGRGGGASTAAGGCKGPRAAEEGAASCRGPRRGRPLLLGWGPWGPG